MLRPSSGRAMAPVPGHDGERRWQPWEGTWIPARRKPTSRPGGAGGGAFESEDSKVLTVCGDGGDGSRIAAPPAPAGSAVDPQPSKVSRGPK